jgi:hypothetical protein
MNAQPLSSQLPPAFVLAADGRFGYCGTCAAETVFERPWCVDGHGDLCSEWVCTDCGTAVIVEIGDYLDPPPVDAAEQVRSIAGSRRVAAA